MKFGFDLDEVVVDITTEVEKYLEIEHGIKWSKEYCIKYDFKQAGFHNDPEVSEKIAKEIMAMCHDPDFQFNADPVEGARDVLIKFKRAGHQIYFISSRPKQNQPATFKWLRKNNIPFDSVDVIGNSGHKGFFGRKYNLDMYVDDLQKHLVSMHNYKKRWRKGLILFDRPWNRENFDGSRFIRMDNWQAILRHIGVQKR